MESIEQLVATADQEAVLAELDRRVRELEAAMGDLRSVKASAAEGTGRKTVVMASGQFLAKGAQEAPAESSVDEALRSLSVEQRLAVKGGLLRAGLLK